MTAKEAMRKVFKGKFSEKEKAQMIQSLQKLNSAIPSPKNQSQIKKLEQLKTDGLIDENIYKTAIEKIKSMNNGFDEETLKKLAYYRNVIATLIKALQ